MIIPAALLVTLTSCSAMPFASEDGRTYHIAFSGKFS
jgi:hypothetical protein